MSGTVMPLATCTGAGAAATLTPRLEERSASGWSTKAEAAASTAEAVDEAVLAVPSGAVSGMVRSTSTSTAPEES